MFTLTSRTNENTLDVNIGDGVFQATATFRARSREGKVIVNHYTMSDWGTKVFEPSEITVNGQTFTDAAMAVETINALNVNFNDEGGSGGGIPDAPVDGKLYGRQNGGWAEVTGGGGGDGYVPYSADGISVSTKTGGSLNLGTADGEMPIARLVDAGSGQLTLLSEVLPGTDLTKTLLKIDTSKPLVLSDWQMVGLNIVDAENKASQIYLYSGNVDGNTALAYIVPKPTSDGTNIQFFYLNGDADAWAQTLVGTQYTIIGTPVQGWNLTEYEFPDGLITEDNHFSELLSTSTSWGADMATIGYSEPQRLVFGTEKAPLKLYHPIGERVVEAEVDADGNIVAEHDMARLSDVPTEQSIRDIIDSVIPSNPIIRTDITDMFTTSVPVQDFHVELSDFGEGRRRIVQMWGQDTSGTNNTLVITAAKGFGSYYDHTGENAFTVHGRLVVNPSDGSRSASHCPVDVTPETNVNLTTLTFAPQLGYFDITYFLSDEQSSRRSYWMDIDGTLHPLTALWAGTTSGASSNVVIDGISVPKYRIREVSLGSEFDSLTVIPNYLCNNFASLQKIVLPSGLTQIGDYAFQNCTALSLVSLPSGLTQIGNYAFYNCRALSLASLPSGLTQIGTSAFYNCTALNLTSLPSGLTQIGTSAFQSCTALSDIDFNSLDVSSIDFSPSAFGGVKNTSACTRRHATQALADAAIKFTGLSNWTVVINGA